MHALNGRAQVLGSRSTDGMNAPWREKRHARWRARARAVARALIATLVVCVSAALIAAFVVLMRWPVVNEVVVGATPEYPHLMPRAYAFTQARVFAGVEEALIKAEWAHDVRADRDAWVVDAVVDARFRRLQARVSVRVEPNGDGGAIVHVASQTDGRGDFGQNARNVDAIYEALELNLGLF